MKGLATDGNGKMRGANAAPWPGSTQTALRGAGLGGERMNDHSCLVKGVLNGGACWFTRRSPYIRALPQRPGNVPECERFPLFADAMEIARVGAIESREMLLHKKLTRNMQSPLKGQFQV